MRIDKLCELRKRATPLTPADSFYSSLCTVDLSSRRHLHFHHVVVVPRQLYLHQMLIWKHIKKDCSRDEDCSVSRCKPRHHPLSHFAFGWFMAGPVAGKISAEEDQLQRNSHCETVCCLQKNGGRPLLNDTVVTKPVVKWTYWSEPAVAINRHVLQKQQARRHEGIAVSGANTRKGSKTSRKIHCSRPGVYEPSQSP